MNDENKLNPGHKEMRNVLRKLGPAVLITGLAFTAVGLISFFSAFGSFGPPRFFWCAFIGLPMTAVGIALTKFAYLGAISRYMVGEGAPVAKDAVNYLAGGTRGAVRDIVGAVREGLTGEGSGIVCSSCGQQNDTGAKFCDQCGADLETAVACPHCSAENLPDARFCCQCGNKLRSS